MQGQTEFHPLLPLELSLWFEQSRVNRGSTQRQVLRISDMSRPVLQDCGCLFVLLLNSGRRSWYLRKFISQNDALLLLRWYYSSATLRDLPLIDDIYWQLFLSNAVAIVFHLYQLLLLVLIVELVSRFDLSHQMAPHHTWSLVLTCAHDYDITTTVDLFAPRSDLGQLSRRLWLLL